MAYVFRPILRANLYVMWSVCDYVMVEDQFYGVSGLSEIEHCILGWQKSRAEWQTGVCLNFHTPL